MNVQKLIIMFFVISLLVFVDRVKANIDELPLLGKVIFVDPGHGGRDPGTMHGNLLEKDIVLEISRVLRDELLKKGAIVYMTRDADVDLSTRWDNQKKRGDLYRRILLYKKHNADLYLSIHVNHFKNPSWSGAEILYHPINKNNEILGEILMTNFKERLGSKRRLKTTDLYMYKSTTIPGVLIECGFISNPRERKLLQDKDYQLKISEVITDSVIEYFRIIE